MASLSDAALSVWAKSSRTVPDLWLPLWCHLDDSAGVAARLWDEWLPTSVRRRIVADLDGDDQAAKNLATWLAGVHDIGKATPAFAVQVTYLANPMVDRGLKMPNMGDSRRLAPHALAGQIILEEWLQARHNWRNADLRTVSIVVGGHHGVPPTKQDYHAAIDRPHLLGHDTGQELWRQVQNELLDRAADLHRIEDVLRTLAGRRLSQPTQVLLTGFVIVADWIASNEDLFRYTLDDLDRSGRAESGWEAIDLPSPWQAVSRQADPASFYIRRFDFPADTEPRPIQTAALAAAAEMHDPGMMIIEAPMGEGKTEAALAAAESFAAATGAGGVLVALPTRATSDAMFTRVSDWLSRIPDVDADPTRLRAIALAHGKAALNDDFRELIKGTSTLQTANDDVGDPHHDGEPVRKADLAVHHWLRGRKKSMLAPFVIGTIDQLLFAALKSKHLALRHLGLAGKVVVIDEAHAYDVYMNVYLDEALEWLGAYGVPVIILSATLPSERRRGLVDAYQNGKRRGGLHPTDSTAREQASHNGPADSTGLAGDIGYPSIVTADGTAEPSVHNCPASGRSVDVQLAAMDDELDTLVSTLRRELSDGGCALVIRNTVSRVQDAARALLDSFAEDEITVVHSRFLAPDRAALDTELRDRFGPPGRLRKAGRQRPHRHIVVASQVAEQSLDIDFDLLISDLAPIDLLLQRTGRIHRHGGVHRPERVQQPRCLITGVDWTTDPPEPVPGSVQVYGRYPLLRSLAVLRSHLNDGLPLVLPDGIAPLVQLAYGADSVEPVAWRPVVDEARHEWEKLHESKRRQARSFRLAPPDAKRKAIADWLEANVGNRDDTHEGLAQVRDSTADSLEVIALTRHDDGRLALPSWLPQGGGRTVPTESAPSEWLAREAAGCTIRLPHELCNLDAIHELEQREHHEAWKQTSFLADELVLAFDEEGCATVLDRHLFYDKKLGLKVSRRE